MKIKFSLLMLLLCSSPFSIYAEGYRLHSNQFELGKKLEVEVIAPESEEVEVLVPTAENILERYQNKELVKRYRSTLRFGLPTNKKDVSLEAFERHLNYQMLGMNMSKRFRNLQRYMVAPIPVNEMCVVLKMAADMYLEIGDRDEALQYLRTAHLINPRDRRLKKRYTRLDNKVNPKANFVENLRVKNEEFNRFMNVSLGIEHASNVIQEAINAAVPTNKEDFMLTTSFMYSKSWPKKVYDLSQDTRVSISHNLYEDHKELNLLNSSLEHAFSGSLKKGNDDINYGFKLGLGHIFSTHHSLLLNKILGTNMLYFHNDAKLLFTSDLTYTKTDYFAEGSDGEGGFNVLFNIGGMKFLDDKGLQTINVDLSQGIEQPKDPSLRYDESSVTLGYTLNIKDMWVSSVGPTATYKMRNYSFDDGTGKREDKQWVFALDAEFPLGKKSRFQFRASTLENESNKTASHYENHQVSFTYNLDI
jgi:hypothetical protein